MTVLPSGVERAQIGNIGPKTYWSKALADIDGIVHLAARVHVMHDSAADPLSAFRQVNVAGTERLAQQAAEAGVKRMVYLSSVKVNGEETEVRSRRSEVRKRQRSEVGGRYGRIAIRPY
jgi:nucleoside-diphosphate-sugar epimerase